MTAHEERHDHVNVENFGRSEANISRAEVKSRVLAGRPPSTFQANIGADVLRWAAVDTDEPSSGSRIAALDELFSASGLERDLPEALIDQLRMNPSSELVAIPLNIHRVNLLYYNIERERLYRASNDQRSFLAFEELCPDPIPPGDPAFTMGAGTKARFVLILLAFENVLPALTNGRPDFYNDLFAGRAPVDWEKEVKRAFECVQYLSRAFADDDAGHTWVDAIEQVADGKADFTVMGDWANGILQDHALGEQVEVVEFPKTAGVFVFTSDTFPLPIGAPHLDETRELLLTIASLDVQNRFSVEKGSIPARIAGDSAALGPYAERAEHFLRTPKLLATSGLFPPYYPVEELESALFAMTRPNAGPPEVRVAVELFRDAEPLFKRWQDRRAHGRSPAPP
jgi:glucose/mannose transport system substrate-binding protein